MRNPSPAPPHRAAPDPRGRHGGFRAIGPADPQGLDDDVAPEAAPAASDAGLNSGLVAPGDRRLGHVCSPRPPAVERRPCVGHVRTGRRRRRRAPSGRTRRPRVRMSLALGGAPRPLGTLSGGRMAVDVRRASPHGTWPHFGEMTR
jgi:hypothetical protein